MTVSPGGFNPYPPLKKRDTQSDDQTDNALDLQVDVEPFTLFGYQWNVTFYFNDHLIELHAALPSVKDPDDMETASTIWIDYHRTPAIPPWCNTDMVITVPAKAVERTLWSLQ